MNDAGKVLDLGKTKSSGARREAPAVECGGKRQLHTALDVSSSWVTPRGLRIITGRIIVVVLLPGASSRCSGSSKAVPPLRSVTALHGGRAGV